MIDNNIDIKSKFSKMVEMIFITGDGKFLFPFEHFQHDDDLQDFVNHSDYSILESKMNNLIGLLNKDLTILDKDLEDEVWFMV